MLSAGACVKRLEELGFESESGGSGMTLLRKDERRVIVPHVTIELPMLHAILRSAGISEAQFFARRGSTGTYTRR